MIGARSDHALSPAEYVGAQVIVAQVAQEQGHVEGPREDSPVERAHGDGMMISVDSPEAFEEIIWKGFWPSRYLSDRIVPWAEPEFADFERFFRDHMRKIILLRSGVSSRHFRYISKNNPNISRIGYLKRVFPDSIIVVPFRAPLQHASSMLRQHRNFTKIHEQDPFALRRPIYPSSVKKTVNRWVGQRKRSDSKQHPET